MAFYTGFEPDAVGFSEVFLNLCVQDLAGSKIFVPLQSRFGNGAVAQLNRASDYGSEGCGFESLRRRVIRSHGAFLYLRIRKHSGKSRSPFNEKDMRIFCKDAGRQHKP